MRIKAEHFDIAVRTAYKKKNDAGILFDPGAMAEFRIALNELARNRKPTDAPVMTDAEIKAIKPAFNKLLKSAVKNFAPQSDEFKDNANVIDYALVAHDYVVALMLDTLKCNEIPKKNYLAFGNDVSDLARNLIKAKSDKMKETTSFFNEQRRINADELEENVSGLMNEVSKTKTNFPKPETIAKLYGEYQALMKRQKNHGRIWRSFHKKENTKRTELLAKMKKTLSESLPNAIMLGVAQSPSFVQKYIEHKNMENFIHQYVGARDYNPALRMGYEEYINNPEALNDKKTVSIKDLVKVDYRPNIDNLEEMKVMQELRNAVVEGLLFKDNPALKQLVYRNHMRLGMAENMARKPDWEKYCAGEDENFLAENPGFEVPKDLPNEIPKAPEAPAPEAPAPEKKEDNNQRERIDGDKIKEDMGEKNVAIEDKRPEEPTVSSPNKNIG